MKRVWVVRAVAIVLGLGCVARLPAAFCARRADAFFDGDARAERALGRGARDWLDAEPGQLALHTGSARFDGEWYLIVHMAVALAYAQTALAHAELRAEHAALAERAIDRLLLPEGRAHDVAAWRQDPLAALDDDAHGHLAFLGYANLALSMHRRLDPASRFARVNDAITEALARRFAASPTGLLESYPDETYPADNAAALASILLHDRATGGAHPVAARVVAALRDRCTDAASGLQFQRVDSATAAPLDGPRASGTAMAAFLLGYADEAIARPWWDALARQWDTVLGFGGAREVPPGAAGEADVDSGPVILGIGVSATALAAASARRFGDRARFRSAFASAWLFGLPDESDRALRFAAGGPLGNAVLFAVLTAGDGR